MTKQRNDIDEEVDRSSKFWTGRNLPVPLHPTPALNKKDTGKPETLEGLKQLPESAKADDKTDAPKQTASLNSADLLLPASNAIKFQNEL